MPIKQGVCPPQHKEPSGPVRGSLELAGFLQEGICPRRKVTPDSPLHQFWQCTKNNELGDEVNAAEDLVKEALAGGEKFPCLWL